MSNPRLPVEFYEELDELVRIGRRAIDQAQEENRRKGVPNVYSINRILYYELPSGELSRPDPWDEKSARRELTPETD
jgi:hypothetical protein